MSALLRRSFFLFSSNLRQQLQSQKAFKSDEEHEIDCAKYRSKTDYVGSGKGLALPIPLKEAISSPEDLEYAKEWRTRGVETRLEEKMTDTNFIPKELQDARTARIYRDSKNAMQSASGNCQFWKVSFDTLERWENPLMGWTSTGDPLSNVKLNFYTLADAVRHCERNGWDYYVDRPREIACYKIKRYKTMFSWNKRCRTSTKWNFKFSITIQILKRLSTKYNPKLYSKTILVNIGNKTKNILFSKLKLQYAIISNGYTSIKSLHHSSPTPISVDSVLFRCRTIGGVLMLVYFTPIFYNVLRLDLESYTLRIPWKFPSLIKSNFSSLDQ